jgi:Porin PorA
MRRVLGLTLTGLGAFFIVLGLLLRFYLPGQVIKFPLNEYVVTTLTGHNLTYFSQKQVKELTGINAKATSTVEGDVTAGSSSIAVWNDFTAVQDVTNHEPISYSSQRSGFDRRTGALVNCCGGYVNSNTKVIQSGQGYVWPIGTQKQTYQVFDTTLLKPEPFRYAGTTTVDGLTAYKFVEHVVNRQFTTQTLPGSLVGLSDQPSVRMPEYITETNTYWIDPVTGAVLNVNQNQTLTLQQPAGTVRLILFQGTLTQTPQSTAAAVHLAGSSHTKISWIQTIGPIVAVLLGIVLLIVGVALTMMREDSEEYEYENDEPVGSTT